jgi:hypothetical protein
MIDAKGLQHAPETMTEMDSQGNEGHYIKERVKEIAQQLLDSNRYRNMFRRKSEAEDMDKKECQDK